MGEFVSVSERISELRTTSPYSVALRFGSRTLCYEELDFRARRLAGYLVHLGVVPGGTVALCLDRSFDWVISALAIMHAGAAYVPLDSAWPDSRLQFALEDSGATVLVSPSKTLARLTGKVHGVDPVRDYSLIGAMHRIEPRPVRPESVAYVIYTSEPTGVPRGVEITHGNLMHLVHWHREAFGVTADDRASHLAGLGFDAAVWELWPNLCAGATVCLADEAVRSSPELIQQWMIRERVTIGFVPTTHAAPLMAMQWPATTELRYLLTAGGTLHHAPADGLPFQVVNNYGPTECTVVATSGVVKPGSQGAPPIGWGIAGANIYLLDETGAQVRDGDAGEICIGGNGVGRGYRGQPDATQRSFVADPFAGVAGARIYRSGDLGMRRPDGQIEFLGRLDRQAKMRGQRAELEAIGNILNQHAVVEFAILTVDRPSWGEAQLIGYALRKQGVGVPTAAELQEFL